ncbi:hypothetical protein LSAT2_011287 [Lamellibrachia satsuma]|nr:hypothetical protein LSAT2_011287 [Lamellibrachia satsuma]
MLKDESTYEKLKKDPTKKYKAELFRMVNEENNTMPFLDAKFTRKEDGSVKSTVYRKKTHTDKYLNFASHHPKHQKLGVVRTLMHRCETITSEEGDKKEEVEHLRGALKPLPASGCADLQCYGLATHEARSFTVYRSRRAFKVSCDFITDGGGWTVLLRRRRNQPQSLSFDRPWSDYVAGFGDVRSEFWIGLDPTLRLVTGQDLLLRHDIVMRSTSRYHALYSGFRLGSATQKYPLSYSAFMDMQSSADNGHINNSVFQTPDSATRCAKHINSAGWFVPSAINNLCYKSILFGSFDGSRKNIMWAAINASIDFIDMKYRPSNFLTADCNNPCQHNGICRYSKGKSTCHCMPNYRGNTCAATSSQPQSMMLPIHPILPLRFFLVVLLLWVVPSTTTAPANGTSTWQVNNTGAGTHHFSVTDKSGDCLCQNGGSCVSSLPNAPTLVCKCPRDFGGDLCEESTKKKPTWLVAAPYIVIGVLATLLTLLVVCAVIRWIRNCFKPATAVSRRGNIPMDKTSQGKAPTVTNDKGEMDMSAIYDFVVQETRQQIEASQVVALQRLNVSMITITQDATLQKLMDATQRNIANTPQPTIQRKPQSGTPTDTKRRSVKTPSSQNLQPKQQQQNQQQQQQQQPTSTSRLKVSAGVENPKGILKKSTVRFGTPQ